MTFTLFRLSFGVAFWFSASLSCASDQLALNVPRIDGSAINAKVYLAKQDRPAALLLIIAGSGCFPSELGETERRLVSWQQERESFSLLIVEKPGPTMPPRGLDGNYRVGPNFSCSTEFKRYYSVDERVADHLRVIQHLRLHAPWWNQQMVVWGFSEGGIIAGRLAPLIPEAKRLAMAGSGGGLSFATYFEDYFICSPTTTPHRARCLEDLRQTFEAIRREPTSDKSWSGDANTYKVWASRLDAVLTHTLVDFRAPILLIHGVEDRSTPVQSARVLANALTVGGHRQIDYVEVKGMGHSVGSSLGAAEKATLWQRIQTWLLDGL